MGVASDEIVGRDREVAQLRALLDDVASGRGRAVVVMGEAGIGKTALLETAIRSSEARGFAVAVGRCAATETPPYWPWPQLLRALDGDEDSTTSAIVGGRSALFAATAERLERSSSRRPAFVVVDDLQWADESSLALSSFLVAAISGLPVAMAFGVRDEPGDDRPGAWATLDSLPADALRIPLSGLDELGTTELLRGVLAHDPPASTVAEVHARTAGNPLFVKEVGRLLAAQGQSTATTIPDGVRKVLTRRVAHLSRDAFAVLAAASVTDDFDLDLLIALTHMPAADITAGLDEARDARLILTDEDGCRFAHALIRETIHDVQPTAQRTEAHRRAGVALEARVDRTPPGGRVSIAGRAAAHWAKVPGDGRRRAAALAVVAARDAAGALGYDQAARLYQWARQLGDDDIDTLTDLGESEVLAGRLADGRRTLMAAAERAASDGRGDTLARAVLAAGAGIGGFEVDVLDEHQVVLLNNGLSLLGDHDSRLRAAALARVALIDSRLSVEQRVARADAAAEMAVRLSDAAAEVSALAARCDVLSGPDHVGYRLATGDRMVAVAEQHGDPFMLLLARRHRLIALLEGGQIGRVDAEIAAYARTSERVRLPLYSWIVPLWRGMRALVDGDLARAGEHCDTADALGRSAESHNADTLVATLRFEIGRAAGSTAALDDVVRRMVSLYEGYPAVDGMNSVHLLLTGHVDEARRVLRRRMQVGLDSVPRDSEWLEALWNLGEVAAAVGELDAVEEIHDALAPYAELWAVDGVGAACYGAVSHQLGRLAAALDRRDDARRWLDAAHDAHTASGSERLTNATAALLDSIGVASAPPASPPAPNLGELVRTGAVWHVSWQGAGGTVRHSKGMLDIARLVAHPDTEVHVVDLVDATGAAPLTGDAGPMLDDTARRSYQQRLRDLDDDIEEACAAADEGRVARLERERDLLIAELSRAYGIGGRARTSGDPAERARKAVSMRIATAVRAIATVHPQLGRHLERSLVTGRYCSYRPESSTTWTTQIDAAVLPSGRDERTPSHGSG